MFNYEDTEQIVIPLKAGGELFITILKPSASERESFFVFALPKSGSVMQDTIFEDICSSLNIPTFSISKEAFSKGINEQDLSDDICTIFRRKNYCFYGFRNLPSYLSKFNLSEHKKILLIRDPRDIVVSHFFSMRSSHTIPSGQVGGELTKLREKLRTISIDDYVLEVAPRFVEIFEDYNSILEPTHLLKIFRYEDIIFNKSQWIKEMLAFLMLELEDSRVDEISAKQDIFPDVEDELSHIRRVTPGDFKVKLKSETIDSLNKYFEDILKCYNYL